VRSAGRVADYFRASPFWNTLDVLSLAVTLASLVAQIAEYSSFTQAGTDQTSNTDPWLADEDRLAHETVEGVEALQYLVTSGLMSLALPLVYLRLLFFLQGHEKTGTLVRMVIGITLGVNNFVFVLLVILTGFTFGFHVLYRNPALADDGSWGIYSPLTSYMLMLGAFDRREFDGSGLAITLFVSFSYFVQLVLLNLLIALMGDLYDEVQETAHAQYIFSKAQLVLECEDRLSGAQRLSPQLFPQWLQVLEQKADLAPSAAWSGRVKAVKDDISKVADSVQAIKAESIASVAAGVESAKAVKELKDQVDAMRKEVGAEMAEIRAALVKLAAQQGGVKEAAKVTAEASQ